MAAKERESFDITFWFQTPPLVIFSENASYYKNLLFLLKNAKQEWVKICEERHAWSQKEFQRIHFQVAILYAKILGGIQYIWRFCTLY